MLTAGLYREQDGWFRISCRYDPDFQSDLKDGVGDGNWKFSYDTKAWYVREHCFVRAKVILRGHGYKVLTDAPPEYQQSLLLGSENPWKEILESLSYDKAHALYRKASSVVHPDLGGDKVNQKQLNLAWEEINKARVK